jgi:peptidoglycan/xylan/chitin deacetylase (PgdA/CDA1 family)
MHASDSAKQTAASLPQVLEQIKKKNLKLVTVSELIANGKSESKEIN